MPALPGASPNLFAVREPVIRPVTADKEIGYEDMAILPGNKRWLLSGSEYFLVLRLGDHGCGAGATRWYAGS